MRPKWIWNIVRAPIVLFVTLPVMAVLLVIQTIGEWAEYLSDELDLILPRFKR